MKNVKFRCWKMVEYKDASPVYQQCYPILDISNEFPPNLKYDLYIGEINGQEIYENDIVNVPFGTHGSGTKSRKEQIFLARVTHTGGFEKLSRDISESHYRFHPKFNQIINKVGNIYESITNKSL